MIALCIALDHPELVKNLILCSTGYYISKKSLNLFSKRINPTTIEKNNPKLLDFYKSNHLGEEPNYWKQLLNQLKKYGKTQKTSLLDLSKIRAPVLIIVGDHDLYGFTNQAIKMHNAIKKSELAIFPKNGNSIPNNKQVV